jgi:hypothetical protein
MMRGIDPERLWQMLKQQAGSTDDTIDLSKLPEPVRRMNRMMAERFGTEPLPESGIMTKEQFISLTQRNMQRMQSGMMGTGSPGNGPPGNWNAGGWGDSGWNSGNWNGYAGRPPSGWGWSGPGNTTSQEFRDRNRGDQSGQEEQKPIALRYGKLPKGLPEWFDGDDLNKDGQISLYEWIKSGKAIEEFMEMDLNRDNLLTADEWLRYRRLKEDEARIAAIMEGTARPSLASGNIPEDRSGRRGSSAGTSSAPGTSTNSSMMIRLPGSSEDSSNSSNNSSPNSERRSSRPNPFQTGGRR